MPAARPDPDEVAAADLKYAAAEQALLLALDEMQRKMGPMIPLGSFLHRFEWRARNTRGDFTFAVRRSIRERIGALRHRA